MRSSSWARKCMSGSTGANNAMVVEKGWSGASPITSWVSHPSAIGYRLQGVVSAGSGSGGGGGGSGSGSGGGGTITIAAVSPDFDSGMNDGTDGQELERVANFYTGTEENPTSAQSAPTPRSEQDIANGVPPGNPIAVPIPERGTGGGLRVVTIIDVRPIEIIDGVSAIGWLLQTPVASSPSRLPW
jgi:hypothetical protein